jgi:hypothetical protein
MRRTKIRDIPIPLAAPNLRDTVVSIVKLNRALNPEVAAIPFHRADGVVVRRGQVLAWLAEGAAAVFDAVEVAGVAVELEAPGVGGGREEGEGDGKEGAGWELHCEMLVVGALAWVGL